jgi:RNA polymerase sigma factor (sigma-70 family)
MRNTPEVAAVGSENQPSSGLTEAQIAEFWAGIIANGDAARRMAAHFVPKQDAEDVAHTAAIQFIESLQRPIEPAPFPKSEEEFRRRYLAIIRNHGIDCIRDVDSPERPVRSHWGVETEPSVGGRKTADRPLDHVFARNDSGNYDAPAEDWIRPQDDVDRLHQILRHAISELPPMQRTIVTEHFLEGRKRAEVARRHGISVKTYDNALQAAFAKLRDELWEDAFEAGDVDRSIWYDRIDQLSDKYDATYGKRLAKRWLAQFKAAGADLESDEDGGKKSGAGAA